MLDELIRNLPGLMLVYSAFILAVASPGPSNLQVMATSMERGRAAGSTLALGVTAGSLTWGILAAVGVTGIVVAHPGALYAIKIVGGLYLLFLAWRSARSAMRAEMPPVKAAASGRRTFLRGYLMHITNPKAILSWTAIIALALRPDTPPVVLYAIIGGCMLISLAINQFYAVLFSTASMIAGYRRIRRRAEACLAAFFTFASFKLLTTQL
ncbi:LysE family translocator [Bosea robiniae]|uniref:Threonine/homoserine/homoserine lactone efflux protein n=1 Tax=Bosea robiniae TaxID=1036780 RepID=A0ABY0NNM2_9HYPH|nr:LysE family translocator [Bosea robiniae]SDF85241.1 Threonine/homoserine/homoserine lactone efflux protein [Bosea robiniae]